MAPKNREGAPHQASANTENLSAQSKLDIREEVERRLTKPPGEALLWVQQEVRKGIDDKVRELKSLGIVAVFLVGLICTILGFDWLKIKGNYDDATQRFDSTHSNLVVQLAEVTNTIKTLSLRIEELRRDDNIVTTAELQKKFGDGL